MENRHEMLLNLEKPISELHEMFLDVTQLIESQGEVVNRIGIFSIDDCPCFCCFEIECIQVTQSHSFF